MRTAIAPLLIILLAACSGTEDAAPADTAAGRQPAITKAPTPGNSPLPSTAESPASTQKNVTLAQPAEGQPVSSNPLTISGTARTFENHVSIRIRDASDAIILETFATARGELGSFNPWETSVLLPKHPGDRISVEAFDVSAKDGSIHSLVRVSAPYTVPKRTVTLYRHDPQRAPTDCTAVFPVRQDVPSSASMARLLVEALIRMPGSPFPEGSEAGRITIVNGTATVDFNERLRNVGGSCRAQAIRASVERTLRELPNVERVTITALGSESQALQP